METMADQQRRLGERIRELRHTRRLTQERLAEAAEISAPYVAQVETGNAMPSVYVLIRIAAALAVPLSGIVSALDTPSDDELTRLRDEVRVLLSACTQSQLRLVLRLISAVCADTQRETR